MAGICLLMAGVIVGCSKSTLDDSIENSGKNDEKIKTNSSSYVIVYQSTEDASKKMHRESNLNFNTNPANPISITVDPTVTYQTIQGLGMALTGSSAYMLKQLTSSARTQVLTNIFSPSNGMGMSVVRLTIGASDYSKTSYTYDDQTGSNTDPSLSDFALKADDINYVIPVLKEILAINPDVYIIASPWSAPAWMKRNNSLVGSDASQNTLMTGYYSVFSKYLVKYIQAMGASPNNITINAITPQNEPRTVKDEYITMYMTPDWQKTLVSSYLRPDLDNAGLTNVKILCADNNWSGSSYANDVLSNTSAYAAVAGSAFHGYGGDPSAMTTIHNSFPNKDIFYTEFSDRRDHSWSSQLAWMGQDHLIRPFVNWSKSVVYWNLALDENSEPNIKAGTNYSRPLVTINSATHALTYNVDYYVLSHVSKFLKPGAQRISSSNISSSQNIYNVAFQNPDGWKTLVVINRNTTSKTVDFHVGSSKFTYTLAPDALVTFNWN